MFVKEIVDCCSAHQRCAFVVEMPLAMRLSKGIDERERKTLKKNRPRKSLSGLEFNIEVFYTPRRTNSIFIKLGERDIMVMLLVTSHCGRTILYCL